MFRSKQDSAIALVKKRRVPNKFILAFAGVAATAMIAAGGFAAAASPNGKPTKEECLKAGFPNYGQCVKAWAHHKPNPGHGYGHGYGGGNSSVVVNLELDHSNNNIITIIVNMFR